MQDFSQLSSRTVTEVLMLEMKMAPAAKAYLVSGYPRSMRDVVEYSEKVKFSITFLLHSIRYKIVNKAIHRMFNQRMCICFIHYVLMKF